MLRRLQHFFSADSYTLKGTLWIVTGRAGLLLISIALPLAFARWVPARVYGNYQYVLSLMAVLSVTTLPGVNTALIKAITNGMEGTLRVALAEKLRWGLLGSIVLIAVACWHALQLDYELMLAFLIASVAFPARHALTLLPYFWIGRKEFNVRTQYMFLSAVLSTSVIVVVIYVSESLVPILAAFLGSYLLFDSVLLYKTLKSTTNNDVDPSAIAFGKRLTLINLVDLASRYADKIVIWQYLGPVQVAVYSFAELPIQRIQEFMPVQLIALPKLGEKPLDGEMRRMLATQFARMFYLSVPAAIALALVAPFAYERFLPQYVESVAYFQALAALIALTPFILLQSTFIADLRIRELHIIQGVAPTLRIVLFIGVTPLYGVWGVIAVILSTEVLRSLMTLHYFRKSGTGNANHTQSGAEMTASEPVPLHMPLSSEK